MVLPSLARNRDGEGRDPTPSEHQHHIAELLGEPRFLLN
jgi:hypothetical protein